MITSNKNFTYDVFGRLRMNDIEDDCRFNAIKPTIMKYECQMFYHDDKACVISTRLLFGALMLSFSIFLLWSFQSETRQKHWLSWIYVKRSRMMFQWKILWLTISIHVFDKHIGVKCQRNCDLGLGIICYRIVLFWYTYFANRNIYFLFHLHYYKLRCTFYICSTYI